MAKRKHKSKKEKKTFIPDRTKAKVETAQPLVAKSAGAKKSGPPVPHHLKDEIQKNVVFLAAFTVFLVGFYLIATQTDIIEPLFKLVGLGDLY